MKRSREVSTGGRLAMEMIGEKIVKLEEDKNHRLEVFMKLCDTGCSQFDYCHNKKCLIPLDMDVQRGVCCWMDCPNSVCDKCKDQKPLRKCISNRGDPHQYCDFHDEMTDPLKQCESCYEANFEQSEK